MVVETAIRSLSLCLGALLLVAVVHKVRVLRSRTAAFQPLLATRKLRGARADAALAAAAVTEAGVASLVLAAPAVGNFAASALLAIYAFELRRLAPDQGCSCFGEFFDIDNRAFAVWRNVALGMFALGSAVIYVAGLVEVAPISEVTVGVGPVVGAAAAGIAAVRRQAAMGRALRGKLVRRKHC